MARPKKDGRLKKNRKRNSEQVSDNESGNRNTSPIPDAQSAGRSTNLLDLSQNPTTVAPIGTVDSAQIPPSGDDQQSDTHFSMPPPSLPRKKSRISTPHIDQAADSLGNLGLHTPPFRRSSRRTSLPASVPMEIDTFMSIESSISSTRPDSRASTRRISTSSTASSITSIATMPSDRPILWNAMSFDDLRQAVANPNVYNGVVPPDFRETEHYFDAWTPVRDLEQNTRLDDFAMNSIRRPRQKLYGTVILQYLLSLARNSLNVKLAVMHHCISSFFEPNRPDLEAGEGDHNAIPKAMELTYGHRCNFDLLIIPIQQIVNDHWTLAIYDSIAKIFLFFDPLHSEIRQWHKDLLNHVRRTALPRNKLKGSIRPAPKREYPMQKGSYECGHHICRIAERYVFNDKDLLETNFNPELFRRQILQALKPVYRHFQSSYDQIRPETVVQTFDNDDSDNESIITANSIDTITMPLNVRKSSRIASKSMKSTPSIAYVPTSSGSLRMMRSRETKKVNDRSQKFIATPDNRIRHNENRRKQLYDPATVDDSKIINDVEYKGKEGIARLSMMDKVKVEQHYSGNFDKICPFCKARLLDNEDYNICCQYGSVLLPVYSTEKKGFLREILERAHPDHRHFIANTKGYNNSLAFASVTNNYKEIPNEEMYFGHKNLVIVNGELRHQLADLDPPTGTAPAFGQLYTIEPDRSREYRAQNPFFAASSCRIDIASKLEADIRNYNPIAKAYMNAREVYELAKEEARLEAIANGLPVDKSVVPRFRMTLLNERDVPMNAREPGNHPGTLALPTPGNNQIHIAWKSSNGEPPENLGTWVVNNSHRLRHLKYWDPNVDPLAYPLIFQEGEQGFKKNKVLLQPKQKEPKSTPRKRKKQVVPKMDLTIVDDVEEDEDFPIATDFEDPVLVRKRKNHHDPYLSQSDNEDPDLPEHEDQEIWAEDQDEVDLAEESEIDYGEDVECETGIFQKQKYVTRRQFDKFHYMRRGEKGIPIKDLPHHIFTMKSLGQMLVIDHRLRQEVNDIDFHKKMQEMYRHDNEEQLREQITKMIEPGQKLGNIYLSSKRMPGTRRYYQDKYCNASAVYDQVGPANLFLTFTMNPHLPEVVNAIPDGYSYLDAFDITSRIFQDKVKALHKDILKKDGIFGKSVYLIGSREWQKRALSHGHYVIKIHPEKYRETAEWVDEFISAEIPEEPDQDALKRKDPAALQRKELRDLVLNLQIHKCNEKSQCWDKENNKCSKRFPHDFSDYTDISERFVKYKRREYHTYKMERGKKIRVSNADVVPYNWYILLKYRQHHCLEYIRGKESLKYSLDYILKGNDRNYITATKSKDRKGNQKVDYDEPRHYRLTRVMGPNEAFDKTMGYPVTYCTFSVEELPIHLPRRGTIVFEADAPVEDVQRKLERVDDRLTAFLKQCRDESVQLGEGLLLEKDCYFQDMLYQDLPKRFTWDPKSKLWKPRKSCWNKLGRIKNVSPTNQNLYALRVLLKHTKCPGAYSTPEDEYLGLRYHEGVYYPDFYAAAHARGLIVNDSTWDEALHDMTVETQNSWRLRHFFARMITNCGDGPFISDLWNKYLEYFLPPSKKQYTDPNEELNDRIQREDMALRHLYYLVLRFTDKSLSHYGFDTTHLDVSNLEEFENLPQLPQDDIVIEDINFYLRHDLEYNDDQRQEVLNSVETLSPSQREAFEAIVNALNRELGSNHMIFIQGNAGHGKTYLIRLVEKYVRIVKNLKILFCATTGIAATLLPEGRTAHALFKLPTKLEDLNNPPQIAASTPLGKLLINADVIVLDECVQLTKTNLHHISTVLCDLTGCPLPFGGKVFILSGDFQQSLPVVKNRPASAAVEVCIKRSDYYNDFSKFIMKEMMRVRPEEAEWIERLNRIGSGADTDPETGTVLLPKSMFSKSQKALQEWIFDNEAFQSDELLKSRALLAPKNKEVFCENNAILTKFTGGDNNQIYDLTATNIAIDAEDTILERDTDGWDSINVTGLPPHRLLLKVGSIVMLIKNISVMDGLTNGTRLIVQRVISNRVVICRVITGIAVGKVIEFPPYCFEYQDDNEPLIHFKRYQFPFRLSFSMTISKAQGQTLGRVGINLSENVFAHGQLYVSLTRATTQKDVRIYQPLKRFPPLPNDPEDEVRVRNVVIQEILGL